MSADDREQARQLLRKSARTADHGQGEPALAMAVAAQAYIQLDEIDAYRERTDQEHSGDF